jgi:hypothetical protein
MQVRSAATTHGSEMLFLFSSLIFTSQVVFIRFSSCDFHRHKLGDGDGPKKRAEAILALILGGD